MFICLRSALSARCGEVSFAKICSPVNSLRSNSRTSEPHCGRKWRHFGAGISNISEPPGGIAKPFHLRQIHLIRQTDEQIRRGFRAAFGVAAWMKPSALRCPCQQSSIPILPPPTFSFFRRDNARQGFKAAALTTGTGPKIRSSPAPISGFLAVRFQIMPLR